MKAVIIANGELKASTHLLNLWRGADLRLAADGGARHAREQFHIPPHIVIGDFDSLDLETMEWLEESSTQMIQHPLAKDQTDLELAFDLARSRRADEITILGALHGRVDQMLANILLLTRLPQVKIVDNQSEMWLAHNRTEIAGSIGDTVSLIPVSQTVEGIETSGLAYPLKNETLALGTTRGVSNEMTATHAQVSVDKGLLLIVHLFKNYSL